MKRLLSTMAVPAAVLTIYSSRTALAQANAREFEANTRDIAVFPFCAKRKLRAKRLGDYQGALANIQQGTRPRRGSPSDAAGTA
jgi:hypothetical protein